jgi:acyl transferase domain-containing protein
MDTLDQIAVIGMAGRFPGASDTEALWRLLRDGVEAISRFSDEELTAAGVPPEMLADPRYVKARGILRGAEMFDADFFGIIPREAEVMDPQQRLFLETAWQACENAGYDPHSFPGRVGVYGGAASPSYLAFHILPNPALIAEVGGLQVKMLNDKDFLTTHASYKLNLRGPSMAVQTACSTSLVAVHLACQSLLGGECDMALAGGVGVSFPQVAGYMFEEGSIGSPDGHTRTFDAKAQGVVEGTGVGLLVLKRLADALEDGDTIHAVIRGSAINNDGASKAGYSAPSIDSQAEVISEALVVAQVEADTIGMVEAHGSGTPIGDPIEVAALTRAYRASTDRKGFCALGSIKTNVGHCDAAAGVAGMMKAVLALEHAQIPPSLHFETPNPALGLDKSPFYVPTSTRDWPAGPEPRRAAVSSLGIGGTNAHIVLEEAPPAPEPSPSRPWQLLLLSARTPGALEAATTNLAAWLSDPEHGDLGLADAAHTLRVGRKAFRQRRALVCRGREEAARLLAGEDAARLVSGDAGDSASEAPGVAFLFSGMGDHYAGMAAELYPAEPVFRDAIDRCAEILRPEIGLDLREALWPASSAEPPSGAPRSAGRADMRRLLAADEPADDGPLGRTRIAHPALFAVEYALATLLMEWGIRPAAMIGYSLGEYVAACLAGVFSLKDALRLVATRARLVDALPEGAMLAVPLPAEEIEPLLGGDLSLAAADGPALSVIAGPAGAIDLMAWELGSRGVVTRRLRTIHAFHSRMMEPAAAELERMARGIALSPPSLPFVSNVTGTWITEAEATDPRYWARHLAATVRFAEGIGTLMAEEGPRVFLEVGPGRSLATLARQHPNRPSGQVEIAALRDRRDEVSDQAFLLDALGRLWLAGVVPDWSAFVEGESRRRVPLPTYPFERRRYFIEAGVTNVGVNPGIGAGERLAIDDWFSTPVWERSPALPAAAGAAAGPWLVVLDELGIGERVAATLEEKGETVSRVGREGLDWRALFRDLRTGDGIPGRIVHCGSLTAAGVEPSVDEAEERGFQSLLALAQAVGEQDLQAPLQVIVVSNGLFEVTGDETVLPAKATLLGICRVLPQEVPHVTCSAVDLSADSPETLAPRLAAELLRADGERAIALRGRHRWVRRFRRVALPAPSEGLVLRRGGVWMIAGGLGESGIAVAEHLFRTTGARLALIAPEDAPPRERWGEHIGARDEKDEEALRLRRILALEAERAEVMVLPVDLARPGRAEWAVARVRERFGDLHGVIQAEADPTGGLLLWTTRDAAALALTSKVRGTLALAEATRGLPLDAFLLFGSSSAVTGGLGQAVTSGVSSFLDALAWRRAAEGLPAQTIDWGFFRWQPVIAPDPAVAKELADVLATYGLTSRDVAASLDRILVGGLPQVTVATQDLEALSAQLDAMGAGLGATVAVGEAHPRPELSVPYVEPANETQETIARIWQESFGLDRVGIEDNFFDLAGNSLLAIQIVTRINTALGTDLPMAALLEAPTIVELEQRIEASRPQEDEDELARLLAEIESLSVDEAEARLASELQTMENQA